VVGKVEVEELVEPKVEKEAALDLMEGLVSAGG